MLTFEQITSQYICAAEKLRADYETLSNGSVVIKLGKGKQKYFILSGVHGNEVSGPLALLHWLRTRELTNISKMTTKQITIVPLLCSLGWNKNARLYGRRNLNNEFEKYSLKFIEELRQLLKDDVPHFFMDMHEDSESKRNYVWKLCNNNNGLEDYMSANLKSEVTTWRYTTHWSGSSEVFVRKLGTKNTITTETIPSFKLQDRVNWQFKAIDLFLSYK